MVRSFVLKFEFVALLLLVFSCKDEPVPEVTVAFSSNKETVVKGESIQFTDESTGGCTSWSWDFEGGDPANSKSKNPIVKYNTPGEYTVTLTAANAKKNGSLTKSKFIHVIEGVTTSFKASDSTIYEGQSIQFSDLSTGDVTQWNWTFEGGTPATSTEKNPMVAYAAGGLYTVTLKASNSLSNESVTKNQYISVVPTSGLRAYYKFDGNLDDSSGNGFNGALLADPSFYSFASNRYDQSSKASQNINDKGGIDIGTSVANDIRTISMWFSPATTIDNTVYNENRLLGRGGGEENDFVILFESGVLEFKLYKPSGSSYVGYRVVSLREQWNAGTWYHAAIVMNPTAGLSLYINGVKQSSQPGFFESTGLSTAMTTIGRWGAIETSSFKGRIDDVRFYNRALSEKEVVALFRE